MKKTLLTLIILLNVILVFPQQISTAKRVSISNPSDALLSKIKQTGIDLTCGPRFVNNNLELELSGDELMALQRNGISYNVLIDDLTKHYAEKHALELPFAKSELNSLKSKRNKKGDVSATQKSLSIQDILVGNPVQHDECSEINWTVPSNFQLGSMGGCLTVSEALAQLDLMRSLYPNLISVKTDASSTGQTTHGNSTGSTTWAGQSVYYVRISDNPDIEEPSEPETLITGMTHSREVNSLMNVMYFMWYILENYNSDPFIKNVVDNQQLYFIPIVNPDGLRWNEVIAPNGGGLQRKNLRPGVADNGSTNTSNNVRGVDLNRNFNYYWGWDNAGSSPTTSSNTYRGPSAGSEPETQIIQDFVTNHNIKVAVNHHGGLNSIVTSSYNGFVNAADSGREDEYAKICHDLTHYNRYIYGSAPNTLYEANGDANDWMLGGTPVSSGGQTSSGSGKDVLAFAPENGDDFWPAPSQITPIAQKAMRMNFLSVLYSGKFAKLHDLNTSSISSTSGNLTFGVEYLGKTYDDITLTVTPVSTNIASITSPSVQSGWSKLERRDLSIPYTLNAGIQPNEEIKFQVTLSNNDFVIYQANYVKYYQSSILFQDDPDVTGTSNWTTSGGSWGITTDSYSGSAAITDSPSGAYSNNENKSITLNSAIDLSGTSQALVQFFAKWDLERNYDLVQLEASINGGSSWTALCGNYNKPTSTFDTNFHLNKNTTTFREHQSTNGDVIYDGDSMDKWVMEEMYINATENSFLLGQNNVQFRFRLKSDSTNREDDLTTTFDGFIFDDFKITSIQVPCIATTPTGLTVGNITTSSASVNWDVTTSATYDLRYRETGSSTWIDITDISGTSTTLSGLNPSTNYEVQLRSRCTSATSSYTNSNTFTTSDFVACTGTSINTFPYSESFEGSIGDWSQSSSDDSDWLINSGTTPSADTGPSGAIDGSSYIFVEASVDGTGFPNKRGIITSPCLDLSGQLEATFSFSYHMFGAADMGTIDLEASNDNGTTWTSLWSQSGNQGNTWLNVDINLDAYAGGSVQLRFNRFVGSTWQADIAIDNINVTAFDGVDSSAPVITLNGNSPLDINQGASYTELGVTAIDNVDGDISANVIIGGDTVDTNTLGSYVVTYNVSDAAGNNATEVTRTVNVNEVSIGCTGGIDTYPYAFGFEGSIGNWSQSSADDLDWLVNSGGTQSNNTGPSGAVEGSDYIYVEASGNNTGYPNKRAIITSPCFDLTNVSEATFSFQYHMFGDPDMGTIDLEISNDDGATWTSIWNQFGEQGDLWLLVNVNLNSYIGSGIQLRFNRFVGGTWRADIAVDDINLTVVEGADTIAPVITLIGNASIDLNVGDSYTEAGATASDNLDGDITANIVIGGDVVDTNTAGTYIVTYNVSDAAGNAALQVTRTVNVIPDTTAPVITLI
ncbi:M14 family zinc carboxypeptidase, partial [Algibacter aquimarinus]|uniref:M14 family zinc carboxypeptidase n=1 Tax=Algibacter aquimarinus TaxID=1136748 RepID=UPI0031E66814